METLLNSIALAYLIFSLMKFQRPSTFTKGLETLISCPKCLTFWTVLFITQDVRLALLSSLSALILDCYVITKL